MATSARELVGWTEQRWAALHEAVSRTLAGTAKCRQVLPKGPESLGASTVPIAMVEKGSSYELKDETTAPVRLCATFQFDDQHADDEPTIQRLVESAAADLGKSEDQRIIARKGGTPRNPDMIPWGLTTKSVGSAVDLPGKDATVVLAAISDAVAKMDDANRPGPCGLILANELLTKLRQPVHAGEAPPLSQAEQLIGTNEIVGTGVLNGAQKGAACGILFRLEPPAVDLVHTLRPKVTVLGRSDGKMELCVEEEIALRILDKKAVIRIVAGKEGGEGDGKKAGKKGRAKK